MKGVCFESVGNVAVRELAEPRVSGPRDAVVRMTMAGLCGSDLHPFWGREVGLEPGTVMGHELVGVVEAVGGEVDPDRIRVGDRVFAPFSTSCGRCFYCHRGLTSRCISGQLFGWQTRNAAGELQGLGGCQSQWVRVPLADSTLMRLPAGVSDEQALLLGDNFSTGYFCAEMAEIDPAGVYAVIGCGMVGQLALLAARSLGAQTLIAVDPVEARRQQAEAWGAVAVPPEQALAEVQARTAGRGADAVLELVGLPEAQQLAYQLLRPGGIMSVIGCHCTPHFAFSPVEAYDKNLTYRTGRCPARHYMERLTDRVAAGEFDLEGLVTHHFDIDQGVRAYDVFANHRDGCRKAVLLP